MATKKKAPLFGNAVTGANKGFSTLPSYAIGAGLSAPTAPETNTDPASAANPYGAAPTAEVTDYNGPGSSEAAAPYNPDTDPVYQAYIASLDLSMAQRQADTTRRKEYLQADQNRLIDETGQAGEISREGISGNYESRGLFNSGGRLRDIARQQANQNSRENNIREGTTRQTSDLEIQLANALAQSQLSRQNARLGVFQ